MNMLIGRQNFNILSLGTVFQISWLNFDVDTHVIQLKSIKSHLLGVIRPQPGEPGGLKDLPLSICPSVCPSR